MIDCNSMRVAVMLSAALLAAGLALGVIAIGTHLLAFASYASLMLVLGSVLVLGTIFVVAMIPGFARRLEGCQH